MTLLIPRTACVAIQQEVKCWGRHPAETGAFLLGKDRTVDVIAWAGERDIARRRDQFAVGGLALAVMFEWADSQHLTVLALLHSHRREAFLSPVDLQYGFDVPGFVSAIVPFYADPPEDPSDWRWWRYQARWQELAPPAVVESPFSEITFDSDGVR